MAWKRRLRQELLLSSKPHLLGLFTRHSRGVGISGRTFPLHGLVKFFTFLDGRLSAEVLNCYHKKCLDLILYLIKMMDKLRVDMQMNNNECIKAQRVNFSNM